jgi:hypothetical protein
MYPSLFNGSVGKCAVRTLLLVGLCLSILACATETVYAQHFYHINKTNGLPSDKVYSFLQDRLGYLWIATDKGVIKYNGYDAHLYNKSEGLPTDDIWAMTDDNSGRVWLGGASGQFGYINNKKYQKAILHNITGTIFPYYLHRFDSGIIFSSPYIGRGTTHSICVSKKDTIFPYTVDHSILYGTDTTFVEAHIHLNSKGELHAASDYFYHVTNLKSIAYPPLKLNIKRNKSAQLFIDYSYNNGQRCFLFDHTFIFYTPGIFNYFLLLDANTSLSDTIRLSTYKDSSQIEYISYSIDRANEHRLFVYTNKRCHVFDFKAVPDLVYSFDFAKIETATKDHRKVLQYLPLPLWDTVVATSNDGVFILPKNTTDNFEKHTNLLLSGYNCVGRVYDSVTYWWNPEQKKLLHICHTSVIHSYDLKGYSINNIIEYNTDTLLVLGAFNHFFTLKDHRFHSINIGKFGAAVKRLFAYKPRGNYILSNIGAYYKHPNYNTDTVNINYVAIDRFRDATYDLYYQKMMVWHDTKLLIFDEKEKINYSAGQITNSNSALIEKVCTEPLFGNVFLKTTDDVLFLDPKSGITTSLNASVNYKNSTIDVWENYFIVLGDFGVSFHRIEGKGKVSSPISYLNVKKSMYKEIHSHSIAMGVVTLQTDAGVYTVKLPHAEEFNNAKNYNVPYRIILQDNHERVLNSGDTVRLANDTRILYADVVNPLGNGTLRIYYRFAEAKEWTKCNGNEIVRPNYITADNFYRFEMYCEDDGWRSDITKATLWVQPTWWQKRSTKYLLWAGGILLMIVVVSVSVAVTNRLVLRGQQKRQMQMELELKAIYAQINPHFIFNALTSAMLLIKKNRMDEAYTHVAKFSRLLRSYLNSSRNKYISIADEVANLTNYMELQQTRFKDRFESIISLEDTLDTHKLIPSLLIQPFVENAINHGILPSEHTGRIEITFRTIKDGIQCTISDNGVGREASRLLYGNRDPTHGSYGNLLIKDLVKVFDKYEEMKINITYRDRKAPDAGTDVVIDITYVQETTNTINTRN